MRNTRTWDGKEQTGLMSGFTEYRTDRENPNVSPAPVLSPDDLLKQINYLRQFMDKSELTSALNLLKAHINDFNNPHHTDLDQFTLEVADIFYKAYVENGGVGTKDYYLDALFKTLRVADLSEINDKNKEDLLVSVRTAREIIEHHEQSSNAHDGLFIKMFPGQSVDLEPTKSFYSYLGINGDYVHLIGDTQNVSSTSTESNSFSFIDSTGYLSYYRDYGLYKQDYSQGRAFIPCFGLQSSYAKHSTDFSSDASLNGTNFKEELISNPENIKEKCLSVISGKDGFPIAHEVNLKTLTLAPKKAYTVSWFVKPKSCDLFQIAINYDIIQTRAVFDLIHHKALMLNGLQKHDLEIQSLNNGWSRCAFTVYNDEDTSKDVEIKTAFFKTVSDDLTQSKVEFAADNETLGYMWGLQVEETDKVSPFIKTNGFVTYRKTPGLVLDLADEKWNTENFTISITFKTPKVINTDKTRTLFSVVDEDGTIILKSTIDKDGNLTLSRYWTYKEGELKVVKLANQEVFKKADTEYSVLTYGVDKDQMVTTFNKETGMNLASPNLSSIGKKIYIGSDPKGMEPLEGYIANVLIYNKRLSENEINFLNGDDL